MNVRVQPSDDWAFAAELMNRPENYDRVSDDTCPPRGTYTGETLRQIPGALLLLAVEATSLRLGCWVLLPVPGGYDAHTLLTPLLRGQEAVAAGRNAVDWVFQHTAAEHIDGQCPETNREVRWYARQLGLREGRMAFDWIKQGVRYLSHHLRLTRSEWERKHLCH